MPNELGPRPLKNVTEESALPIREECLKMIEDPEYNLSPERKEHVLKVNEVACSLGIKLRAAGVNVNIDILDRASLLHDISKETHRKNHAQAAAKIIRSRGWPEVLAEAVKLHSTHMLPEALESSWEAKVLNYADRRVWPGSKTRPLKEWLIEDNFPDRKLLYKQYKQLEKSIINVIGREELEKIFAITD